MDLRQNEKDGFKKLLITGKIIYNKIPSYLRFIFWPIEKMYWLISVLKLDLWIIAGEEILSKQKLTIIYAGIEVNKNFVIKLAFDVSYSENYIGKTWIWKIPKTIKKNGYHCSLIVTEVPEAFRVLFQNKGYFYIPTWIDGYVDTSLPIKNDSFKTDIRRIKKNNLNFKVTNELSQFDNFYYNMHLPYITKTFGNRASIFSYDSMRREFRKDGRYNEVLFIEKNGEYIAGMLIGYTKNSMYLYDTGVKNGNFDYVNDGAIGALFYFPIIYSKEKAYKRVNFGQTRAFLKDGVLQFKKKRGMQIDDTVNIGFAIKPLTKSTGVKGFFLNNPFIYMNKLDFNGAIFVDSDQSMSQEDVASIYKDYYIKGISKLFLYRFGNVESKMQVIVPPELADKIAVCSVEELF